MGKGNKNKGSRKRKLNSTGDGGVDSERKMFHSIENEENVESAEQVEKEVEKMQLDEEDEGETSLNLLPTRESHASQLLVAARAGRLALIEGPIGCGKSFLVGHVAKRLELPLRTMQMGDQVDSKSIFGSYHCTEVAGQFKWTPSAFSKWLTEPGLILIEDIDLANSDVISQIVTINSNRHVTFPSGDVVPFHDNVHLMATVSGKGKKSPVLEGVPVRVVLSALTDEELRRLISKAYPRVAHLAKTLCKVFRSVESVHATGNSRQLTSTDLLRACSRVALVTDLTENGDIFTELVDSWCLADLPHRARQLCDRVATPLSLTADQVHYHLAIRQPMFTMDDHAAYVGRCTMERKPSLTSGLSHRLGHTRDVLQLMERIACCVRNKEPVLLVGETGVGKTSVVQSLASTLNCTLKVVNLSPTSDSDELIEGYKPTTIAHILEPFTKFYTEVFTSSFEAAKNQKFLSHLESCLANGRYRDYLTVVETTATKALSAPEKKTKKDREQRAQWAEVLVRGRRIRSGLLKGAAPFAVTRGAVKEAAEEGYWLLIDEVNLAPPECLDAIVHSISHAPHPNFRLFACMNPATDAGKRRLPAGIRTQFTEFYVAETADPHQLELIVSAYLPTMRASAVQTVVDFYLTSKNMFPGSYSLRTLCRAMLFAADNMFGNLERNLIEAIQMAFLTNLDTVEKQKMRAKINQAFKCQNVNMSFPLPGPEEEYMKVEGYWIKKGSELPVADEQYVITKTVKENLAEISRIVCSGRFPVLLEGETSAGKTSIVCHLAKITGNPIVRINNHEHTDVQEYMGSYVADSSGRLVFREGALVTAVKEGSWVILDELNLAPTDVIEALNRLLDDNRELFVPELNKVIKAHPSFRLFATQNPAGSYAGRKKLSRALLSRFVVLRFPHLPLDELANMVCIRCSVHSTAASKMIAVLSELRLRRSLSGLFSARDGLMTLRDVFRWAKRLSTDTLEEDWLQSLANHGYFLLAGRCRNQKDADTVVETLEKVLKRKIDLQKLFAADSPYMPTDVDTSKIVLTKGMRRMLVMTHQAWLRDEAVLVVGETGGGKTSLAETVGRGKLMTINCHERTETADLMGRLRPKENGGFEWSDGIVISAMREGAPLLVDEISLAEDSVLERLNPLFEENRSLLLSDAGVDVQLVVAVEGYQMIATMNPGGDYGKKELSKALRNRFTEIWSSCDFEGDELLSIFDARLDKVPSTAKLSRPSDASRAVVSWVSAFYEKYMHVFRNAPSVRDIVACADLYAACVTSSLGHADSVQEAIHSTFLDAISSLPTRIAVDAGKVCGEADQLLYRILGSSESTVATRSVVPHVDRLDIGLLTVSHGPLAQSKPKGFSLKAPTCISNFYRIARGLLINKPILLEGAPGCGKSSTVMALAQLTGHPITRLNLSDQTDLSDLFGSDVPVVTEDGSISFRWEDGPVLRAIKKGEWVLLDEMNLASQSVLEGLNACFDHRKVLYIAELNKSFEIPSDSECRFFACQNPRAQGGNRRALPKSFVNRFTNIWVDDLTAEDIFFILKENELSANISDEILRSMVEVNYTLSKEETLLGGPFSYNLRDLLRWIALINETENMASAFDILYVSRMRRPQDKEKVLSIYSSHFNAPCTPVPAALSVDERTIRIGDIEMERREDSSSSVISPSLRILSSQCTLSHRVATCTKMGWLTLLIGQRNCGKRAVVESLANLVGCPLEVLTLNAETDAQELIGSYEQIVDDSHLSASRALLISRLSPLCDPSLLKGIETAEGLLQLEKSAELCLSAIKENPEVVEECRTALELAAKSDMRFAWVDSPFVRAYLNGDWLLIEDVNLCSSAVLDRLNSCLEADGRLVVSERSLSFEPLEPHPNFRVFLSMDSRNGEISRAMRNRSVELWVGEEEKWSRNAGDARAVALSQTKREVEISPEVSLRLCSLTTEQILHFGVLLNEMEVDEACRVCGITRDVDMETDEDESSALSLPLPLSLVTSPSLPVWTLSQWEVIGSEDPLTALFLCTMSASSALLTSKMYKESELGSDFFKRLSPLLPRTANSNHAIDWRFFGAKKTNKQAERFTMSVFFEWMLQYVRSVPQDQLSAEHLSKTLTKYEMTTSDVAFKNLPLIGGLMDAVQQSLAKGDIKGIEEGDKETILYSFVLLLFCVSARRPLSLRSGAAPLYLAWTDLQRMSGVKLPASLSKYVNAINQGWSLESCESFVKVFLSRYEKERVVDPFESQEECERFCTLLEEPKEEEVVEVHVDTEDGEEVEQIQDKSALEWAMELTERMEGVHRFLHNLTTDESDPIFSSQRALCALAWRDTDKERLGRVLSIINSQYMPDAMVSSLSRTAAFPVVFTTFWDALAFDPTMSLLKVSDLNKFSVHALISQLWRMAPNSEALQKKIRGELESFESGVPGWRDDDESMEEVEGAGWKKRFSAGLASLNASCPPEETLDPVVFEEELTSYLQQKFDLLDKQLTMLASFRRLTTGQGEECDSESAHPVIRAMVEERRRLREKIEERKNSHRADVYRQKASLYSSLLSEMRSFLSLTGEVFLSVSHSLTPSTWEDKTVPEMEISLAHMHSYAMSAHSFVNQILRKYPSFVDVVVSFTLGVFIVQTAVSEVAAFIEGAIKKKQLIASSAFPPKFEISVSSVGPRSEQLELWCTRDGCPMPLHLKAALVGEREKRGRESREGIEWTRTQWQKWYERNVAKAAEKDYVYREKTEEEKDDCDVMDFFDQEDAKEREKQVLLTADMASLVTATSLRDAACTEEDDSRLALATAWIRHLLCGLDEYPDSVQHATIDADLRLLSWVSQQESPTTTGPLDVYRSVSVAELRKATKLLDELTVRTKEVQERWPEVVTLRLILDNIKYFMDCPLVSSQMKMAAQLEKVIAQCEEWEKLADRANSVREPLAPLRELLLEWKKMEVRCWASLLERTESDSRQRTQLVAYPLFNALFEKDSKDEALVPMAIEWIHHSALMDFGTRIQSVRDLATWASKLGRAELASQLLSAAAHFEQFTPVILKRNEELRQPAVQSLKDYLRIARYNDLNLWNIKESSHKAHVQLFRIIKKFREAGNEAVAPLLENLVDVNDLCERMVRDKAVGEVENEGKAKRAQQIASSVVEKSKVICDLTVFAELAEQTKDCDELLRTRLNYVGEDKDKEKLQGMERNRRQRAVAMVIKEAQVVGFNARRAVTVNKELLTAQSVTGLHHDTSSLPCEPLVRAAAAGRTVVVRKGLTPNDQVGVSTRSHLVGLVEYGMNWQYAIQKKVEQWAEQLKKVRQLTRAVRDADTNVKKEFHISHTDLSTRLPTLRHSVNEMRRLISDMKDRCQRAPQTPHNTDSSSSTIFHPLSLLHANHPTMERIMQTVTHADTMAKEIEEAVKAMDKLGQGQIYESSALLVRTERISMDSRDLHSSLEQLSQWFDTQSVQADDCLKTIDELVKLPFVESPTEFPLSVDPLLLFVQHLYKTVCERAEPEGEKQIDRYERIAGVVSECGIEKIISYLESLVTSLSSGSVTPSLSESVQSAMVASDLFECLIVLSLRSLHTVSVCYHQILSLAVHLLGEGYVNTIPREEKMEDGNGNEMEGGEGGGMGEGQGGGDAKDVTEEMEETGQIEGLQGEEPEVNPEGPSMENETPIEMEEDFPEDIRDVDRDEKGENDKEEEDEEDQEEPEAEDQIGDVEEADEEQLDPDLWDDEEKDKQENQIDQDNKAADQKTKELAAKDEERDAEKQPEGEEQQENAENGEEDKENADEREPEGDDEDDQAPAQVEEMNNPEEMDGAEEEDMEVDMENKVDGEEEEDMEDAEDTADGEGVEEEENNEDGGEEPEEAAPAPGEEEEKQEKQDEKSETLQEQGDGGEKQEDKEGGGSRDAEEEEQRDEMEEGEGKSKQDSSGEAGKDEMAQEDKEKEDAEGEEKEEIEEAEKEKKKRELATNDREAEEADEGEGEKDEGGKQMEQAPEEERQMIGKGSMEEAKESKKKDQPDEKKKKRRDPFRGIELEDTEDIGDENGEMEELPATVHLAAEDMFSLAEGVTKELVLGGAQQEEEQTKDEAKKEEMRADKSASEVDAIWQEMAMSVGILSSELAENLRLILEPQRATKLQGDYRTGKRLNMRRLIPYIASDYRKDRIWMKRTKRAQREYQVLIAVDDSGSMNEFGMGRVTCESVCVVEDALRRVDAGAVQVVSFGADVRVLSAWGEQTQPGPDLLSRLHFEQKTTDLVGLLNTSFQSLNDIRTPTSEQLLIIISDGRGALAQGAEKVRAALHALAGVTVLFVVLDTSKKSIDQMTVASFEGTQVKLTPYLSLFPFPFYAVVKSVCQLPSVLSESIRQWFEMSVQQNL